MGIELIAAAAGTAIAIPATWKLIDKLINEFFKNSRDLRESDKLSRITIDNHIDHLTAALAKNTTIMSEMLIQSAKSQDGTKEARKDLKATLIENTKASTMQISSNDNVNNTLKELTIVVRDKL
jgi:hypothetical protein|tara:strand:- start:1521 stop:1892 length:372 start_codon:yes stop_codon:yes gene_type:complete